MKFIGPDAEFVFVSETHFLRVAREMDAVPLCVNLVDYHITYGGDGVESVPLGAFIKEYGLGHSALLDLAKIVRVVNT